MDDGSEMEMDRRCCCHGRRLGCRCCFIRVPTSLFSSSSLLFLSPRRPRLAAHPFTSPHFTSHPVPSLPFSFHPNTSTSRHSTPREPEHETSHAMGITSTITTMGMRVGHHHGSQLMALFLFVCHDDRSATQHNTLRLRIHSVTHTKRSLQPLLIMEREYSKGRLIPIAAQNMHGKERRCGGGMGVGCGFRIYKGEPQGPAAARTAPAHMMQMHRDCRTAAEAAGQLVNRRTDDIAELCMAASFAPPPSSKLAATSAASSASSSSSAAAAAAGPPPVTRLHQYPTRPQKPKPTPKPNSVSNCPNTPLPASEAERHVMLAAARQKPYKFLQVYDVNRPAEALAFNCQLLGVEKRKSRIPEAGDGLFVTITNHSEPRVLFADVGDTIGNYWGRIDNAEHWEQIFLAQGVDIYSDLHAENYLAPAQRGILRALHLRMYRTFSFLLLRFLLLAARIFPRLAGSAECLAMAQAWTSNLFVHLGLELELELAIVFCDRFKFEFATYQIMRWLQLVFQTVARDCIILKELALHAQRSRSQS